MLKTAYALGVAQAYQEAGLTKEAGIGSEFVSQGAKILGGKGMGSKALRFGVENPMMGNMAAGAAVGGLGGAAFGDEGGMMRGALMGAGVGAGARLGSRAAIGRQGRLAGDALTKGFAGRMSPRAMEFAKQHGSFDKAYNVLQRNVRRGYAGMGAGALGGGALAYGAAGGMVPGRQ